ncbi:hypothetical protein BGZ73_002639 [Actinomortierella ambigua]|nr:hypothetical protein BGZ73_002639 [Actinomortierella ambigua]
MNLVESSHDDPRVIFFAMGSRIMVYHFATLTPTAPPTYTRELVDPRETADPNIDKTINQIRVGHLDQDEVLVAVDEVGDVCVWFTQNLSRDPLLFNVDESAWGIAIHRERSMIAVSSNAHVATLFHCKADPLWESYPEQGDGEESNRSTTYPAMGHRRSPQASFKQIIRGHEHNVPSVAFSPCGQFLATASVDRSCRVWRIADGQLVAKTPLGPLWGWAVQFVPEQGWIHMTLDEFRRLPKHHLWPDARPGVGIKRFHGNGDHGDSSHSGGGGGGGNSSHLAEHLRRHSPGMERFFRRTIGTRWYAGPLEGERDLGLSGSGSEADAARRHGQHHAHHPPQATTDDDGNMITDDEGDDDAFDIDFYLDQMVQIMQVQMEDDLLAGDGDESLLSTADGEPSLQTAAGGETGILATTTTSLHGQPSVAEDPAQRATQPMGESSSLSSPSMPLTASANDDRRDEVREVSFIGITQQQSPLPPPPSLSAVTSSSSSSQRPVGTGTSALSNIRIFHPAERHDERRSGQRPQGSEGTERRRRDSLRTKKEPAASTSGLSRKGKAKMSAQESQSKTMDHHRGVSSTCDDAATHRAERLDRASHHRHHHYLHRPRPRRYPSELLLCATARNIYLERCGPFVAAEQATDLGRVTEQDIQPRFWGVWPFGDEDVMEDDTDSNHEGGEEDDDEDDEEAEGGLFVAPWDMDEAFGDDDDSIGSESLDEEWVAAQNRLFPYHLDEDDETEEEYWDANDQEDLDTLGDDGSGGRATEPAHLREDLTSDDAAMEAADNEEEAEQHGSGEPSRQGLSQSSVPATSAAGNPHLKRPRSAPGVDSYNGDTPHGGGDDSPPTHRQRRRPSDDTAGGDHSDSSGSSSDNSSSDSESPSDQNNSHNVNNNDDSDEPISLYPISVARSAATRGDGRLLGHLDRYDRLVVMRVVPELGIAIAASQKGTVVVLRLLSIHSASETALPAKAKAKASKLAKDTPGQPSSSSKESQSSGTATQQLPASSSSSSQPSSETRPRYVLFPEVYLPAIDPLPVPLMGMAVSPLLDAAQHTTVGVLVHIVYLNGHLFSYEIRLGKQSCDPPSLDHVFL